MKKLFLGSVILISALLLLVCYLVPAHAETALSTEVAPGVQVGVTNVQVGTFWVRETNTLNIGMVIPVVDYQNLVYLNVGTLTDFANSPPIVAGVNVNINTAAAKMGLGYHLPGDSQIGVFVGWNISHEQGHSAIWGVDWIVQAF